MYVCACVRVCGVRECVFEGVQVCGHEYVGVKKCTLVYVCCACVRICARVNKGMTNLSQPESTPSITVSNSGMSLGEISKL